MNVFSLASPVAVAASAVAQSAQMAMVNHCLGYGQSTSIGVGGRSTGTLTNGLYGALMFNTGLRLDILDGGGVPSSLVPAVETVGSSNYGETGVIAACNTFMEATPLFGGPTPANSGIVRFGSTAGRGGSSIAKLSKGDSYYPAMLGQISDAYRLCQAASKSYAVTSMIYTQGEADVVGLAKRDVYKSAGLRLASDFIGDAMAITGQKQRPMFIIGQLACQMAYYGADASVGFRPEIALAERDMALASDDVFVALPRYTLPYFDNIHQVIAGYELMGRYYGRAEAEILAARRARRNSKPQVCVDLNSALWQGNVIDLQFDVPAPLVGQSSNALAFDTTQVAQANNFGFDLWSADGTTLLNLITNVALPPGGNRVIINCSAAPPAGARLSYGFGRPGVTTTSGPQTGARGNLRDSRGDVHFYTNYLNATQRLDSWCLVFETIKQ